MCDVATVTDARERLGGIDMLVNNAGIGAQGTVEENPDEEWQRVFEVNVFGIVRLSHAALSALRCSAHAAIVNTCSVAANVGLVCRALYSATKGILLALTRAMAAEHLGEQIRVNCVSPDMAETPWVTRLLDQAADPVAERAALVSRQPHGRLVAAEEVAEAICYFVEPSRGLDDGHRAHRRRRSHGPAPAAAARMSCELSSVTSPT